MPDKIYVGNRVGSLEVGEPYKPVSRVTLRVDDDHYYTAGDDTGLALEYDMPWATQEMVNSIYKNLKGFVYRPFKATDAMIDPAAELGDGVTINGQYFMLAQMTTRFDAKGASDIGAPSTGEIDHEYPRLDPVERELKRRVKLGQKYQGVKIDRRDGLTVTETDGETEGAKVVLNSKKFAFYDAQGDEQLYFDPVAGCYKFRGALNVNDNFIVDKLGNITSNGSMVINGSLEMAGDSNWLITRYSTDKSAPVPSGWTEAWNPAWSNTSTQVWAIFSYNGGKDWTQPMLAQGKDGDRGPSGLPGSDADIPDWVKAYTSSAQFNTLVTNEWVISMNLFGSKIFGGEFFDLNQYGRLMLSNREGTISDLVFENARMGYEMFSVKDMFGGATLYLYGVPIIYASQFGGGTAEILDSVSVHAKFK